MTRRGRIAGIAFGAVGLLAVGAGVGWAASAVLTPPAAALRASSFTTAEVVAGEVGSSINLSAVAEWTPVPIGTNLAVGTVTTVNTDPGEVVDAGERLYSVNLRPVIAAEGDIPSFRALSQGTKGADVEQLQALLTSTGHFSGNVDGSFGYSTTVAVRAWQKKLELPVDGVVQPGDVIYLPDLPVRGALDEAIVTRGAVLAGGESVVLGLPASPTFAIPISDGQDGLMPVGTRVEITSPGGDIWQAWITDRATDSDGSVSMVLAGNDGGPICGDDCATLPAMGEALLSSRVVTVESVDGLTVPSAALLTLADGTKAVTDDAGIEHPVTVLTSARGTSAIEGVPAGTRVRVPAAGD